MGEPVTFRGRVRRWDDSKPGGLAVVDIPAELVSGSAAGASTGSRAR